jgi:transcriptional regulator with XRE-family HTH domain
MQSGKDISNDFNEKMPNNMDEKQIRANISEFSEVFRSNLRKYTEAYGNASQLCEAANVNRQQFAKYLSGSNLPTLAVTYRIAQALNISVSDLLGDTAFLNKTRSVSLDSLFAQHTQAEPRFVAEGYYFEASRFSEDEDKYLFGTSKFTRTETGGDYERFGYGVMVDGTKIPQIMRGKYYENNGSICVFYTNISVNNVFGSLALRRLDMYGSDLIGQKTGHMFYDHHTASTSLVVLKYLGTEIDEDLYHAKSQRFTRQDWPEEMKPLIDYGLDQIKFTGSRIVL